MAAVMFSKALERIAKDQPGVGDVHVPSAGSEEKPKRKTARTFHEVAGGVAPGTLANPKPVTKLIDAEESLRRLRERRGVDKAGQPRALKPIDDETSSSPFPHDAAALANMRDDQVPRFFGALTNPEKLETKSVSLSGLTAMQNRVENAKVDAIRQQDPEQRTKPGKRPVVVRMGGRNYIADGHHRLTADWLDGKTTADVAFKDLSPRDNALKARDPDGLGLSVSISKADEDKRQMFGWASVIEKNGEPVEDWQGDIIDVEDLEPAAYDFVVKSREGDDMHVGGPVSQLIESMVFTKEKQAALGIDLGKVGWWTGWQVDDPAVWAAHKRGERNELSIGGSAIREAV